MYFGFPIAMPFLGNSTSDEGHSTGMQTSGQKAENVPLFEPIAIFGMGGSTAIGLLYTPRSILLVMHVPALSKLLAAVSKILL